MNQVAEAINWLSTIWTFRWTDKAVVITRLENMPCKIPRGGKIFHFRFTDQFEIRKKQSLHLSFEFEFFRRGLRELSFLLSFSSLTVPMTMQ